MELVLRLETSGQVTVTCNGETSHSFSIEDVYPDEKKVDFPLPLKDPKGYATMFFATLFPERSPASQKLNLQPERILLVSADQAVQSVPIWAQRLYGVRPSLRAWYPTRARRNVAVPPSDLHIVAVPSNPVAEEVEPLNIDGEWHNLRRRWKNWIATSSWSEPGGKYNRN